MTMISAYDHITEVYKLFPVPGDDSCLIWQGSHDQDGYGRAHWKGRQERIHRLGFIIANRKKIPKGKCVLHICDNPSCFNPNHLFLGSNADNIRDMISKGRAWWQKRRGTKTLT